MANSSCRCNHQCASCNPHRPRWRPGRHHRPPPPPPPCHCSHQHGCGYTPPVLCPPVQPPRPHPVHPPPPPGPGFVFPRHPGPATQSYHWVPSSANAPLPMSAVRGGNDSDGQPMYIGKASHAGDWLPAKIIPGKKVAYVSYCGQEISKPTFQVLCGSVCKWVASSSGNIPAGAIEGGATATGEILYVGRARHNNSITVGKVHQSHKTCYIPYGGRELSYPNYEVLVNWV